MMQDANIQDVTVPVAVSPPQEGAHVYTISREGRRRAVVLLLGVASIWVFALWSLITILQDGISGVEWISSLLMLAMIVVAPMVAWALLEEMNVRITTTAEGITYSTVGGVNLKYGWQELSAAKLGADRGRIARFFLGDNDKVEEGGPSVKPASAETGAKDETESEDEEDEPETVLLNIRQGTKRQISNPVVSFLHRQAHGDKLPIYGGLDDRAALLIEIASHLQLT